MYKVYWENLKFILKSLVIQLGKRKCLVWYHLLRTHWKPLIALLNTLSAKAIHEYMQTDLVQDQVCNKILDLFHRCF